MTNTDQMFAHSGHERPSFLAFFDFHLRPRIIIIIPSTPPSSSSRNSSISIIGTETKNDPLEGGAAVEVLPKDGPGGADAGVLEAAADGGQVEAVFAGGAARVDDDVGGVAREVRGVVEARPRGRKGSWLAREGGAALVGCLGFFVRDARLAG